MKMNGYFDEVSKDFFTLQNAVLKDNFISATIFDCFSIEQ